MDFRVRVMFRVIVGVNPNHDRRDLRRMIWERGVAMVIVFWWTPSFHHGRGKYGQMGTEPSILGLKGGGVPI